MRSKNRAFTLVEIMIVVLIIGILLAIAVPSFFHARANAQTKSCIQNLWEIEQAKEQCAMASNLASGAIVATNQIVPDYIKTWPTCPSGGQYTIGQIDQNATCSLGGDHTLNNSSF